MLHRWAGTAQPRIWAYYSTEKHELWRQDGKFFRGAGRGVASMNVAMEQLRARLPQEPPELTEHDDYDPPLRAETSGAVKAAVLLPVILRDEPVLLFTRRTESLARHSGQVSFPGGRSEARRISPGGKALRANLSGNTIAPSFAAGAR